MPCEGRIGRYDHITGVPDPPGESGGLPGRREIHGMSRNKLGKGRWVMEREIRQRKELCSGPGVEGFSGLSLHLTYLLPHSLEGPPSYKPPTPEAKLEEPDMVSTSPGSQTAPTSPHHFYH